MFRSGVGSKQGNLRPCPTDEKGGDTKLLALGLDACGRSAPPSCATSGSLAVPIKADLFVRPSKRRERGNPERPCAFSGSLTLIFPASASCALGAVPSTAISPAPSIAEQGTKYVAA